MSWIDWAIVGGCMVLLTLFSVSTFRHMSGVADFLSANRSGGRYLLAIASGMSGIGAITVVAMFEAYYTAGFPPLWWTLMSIPVSVIIVLTGWVYYRFRETRCLTMAQFFEARYSRSFRIYTGILTWVSGIVNFGIFPAVASRFFVYFCGLPTSMEMGVFVIPTYVPIMVVTLGMALVYTCLGGQITVMVTDCVQGVFCGFGFIIVCVYLLYAFGWADITTALSAAPAGASMLDPTQTSSVKDFNFWFYAIGVFGSFYGYMSWQGSQGYYSSGLNPHEQKMGQIISLWRLLPQNVMIVLIPVCAFAFMTLTQYAAEADGVRVVLAGIDNEAIRTQMTVPVVLSHILPAGIRGLFCAIMILFLITTQDTYLHSWGSIFIQDVVLPLRKRPFTPKQHVYLLRCSIVFVALFAFLFSAFFQQTTYILMFMAITGAIVSGAGVVIIGGLYWKYGTALASWAAMTIGWVIAVGKIILEQVSHFYTDVVGADRGLYLQWMDWINGINNQWIWFWTMLLCIVTYVVVSLFRRRSSQGFDLDQMLNRGKYQIAEEHVVEESSPSLWWKILGFTREFSRTDRWLAVALVVWNFGWFGLFIVGTACNFMFDIPGWVWSRFWQGWIWVNLGIGLPATIWFAIGGAQDIRRLFKRLSSVERDASDDGHVEHGDDAGQTLG